MSLTSRSARQRVHAVSGYRPSDCGPNRGDAGYQQVVCVAHHRRASTQECEYQSAHGESQAASAPVLRKFDDRQNAPYVHNAEQLWPATIRSKDIGGPTIVGTPREGVAHAKMDRILINLHRGAFEKTRSGYGRGLRLREGAVVTARGGPRVARTSAARAGPAAYSNGWACRPLPRAQSASRRDQCSRAASGAVGLPLRPHQLDRLAEARIRRVNRWRGSTRVRAARRSAIGPERRTAAMPD